MIFEPFPSAGNVVGSPMKYRNSISWGAPAMYGGGTGGLWVYTIQTLQAKTTPRKTMVESQSHSIRALDVYIGLGGVMINDITESWISASPQNIV